MIDPATFHVAFLAVRTYGPNPEQRQAVDADLAEPLFIVAGPGTGKTTVLALRILKLILVDGAPPNGILATTFTVKAAAELRSRILSWGFQLIDRLLKVPTVPKPTKDWLAKVDVNQVLTGTIDSICERLLRDFRDPGTQPPVLVDDFATKTLLLREGLFPNRRFDDPNLDALLRHLFTGKPLGFQYRNKPFGYHTGTMNDLVLNIWGRRFQDQVDWPQFVSGGATSSEQQARKVVADATRDYESALATRGMVDFALLEYVVLTRLQAGGFTEFTDKVKVILVDEYQDSNLMQEQLYFQLARACEGALTVVGDDDQSLYRFRGATVELFSEFEARYQAAFGAAPTKIFLKSNYRSTQNIVGVVNDYANLDPQYQGVRVAEKPPLAYGPSAPRGAPVLGMFRADVQTLAADLAKFVHRVFVGPGYLLPDGTRIERSPDGGDVGDCALLCSSPAEYSAGGRDRLPALIRDELDALDPKIPIFNPRGQDLSAVPLVSVFGGLLLECVDPGGVVEAQVAGLPRDMLQAFTNWRSAAVAFVSSGDAPEGLKEFAVAWAGRDPKRSGFKWSREVATLELIYALVHYLPQLHDDPEGQIYLEVFTRQLQACEQVGKFKGRVISEATQRDLSDASVKELIRDFLGPIAVGTVKVNEDLMEAFPRNRLSVLSIHQAKGLEFPLSIVDVGSDFKSNHHAHAFKRFPRDGGPTHRMEDLLRPHSTDPLLGAAPRASTDRAFDDLIRQFFVAFSRAQDVLLLVGLYPTNRQGNVVNVANVAQGWIRDGTHQWDGNRPYLDI